MENEIDVKLSLDNLSEEERKQFMRLVEKANKPEKEAWKPEIGEDYYSISSGGICCYRWHDDYTDLGLYSIGYCYKTIEEAEFAFEKLKVIAELKRFTDKTNDKTEQSVNKHNKYYIYYNVYRRSIDIVDCVSIYSPIYFSSNEAAIQAIRAVGEERLKKYYFELL